MPRNTNTITLASIGFAAWSGSVPSNGLLVSSLEVDPGCADILMQKHSNKQNKRVLIVLVFMVPCFLIIELFFW